MLVQRLTCCDHRYTGNRSTLLRLPSLLAQTTALRPTVTQMALTPHPLLVQQVTAGMTHPSQRQEAIGEHTATAVAPLAPEAALAMPVA